MNISKINVHIFLSIYKHNFYSFKMQSNGSKQLEYPPLLKVSMLFFATIDSLLLQLQETNFTKLCSTKSMLTVNGSFPGPTIVVHKGDTIHGNVHNQGHYGVTIHS